VDGLSTLPFVWNVYRTAKRAPKVEADDPWGYGRSLEWATSCPPARHNFVSMPRIRSEAPAFNLHYPEVGEPAYPTVKSGPLDKVLGASDVKEDER
jgi:cytochrome c oxidase subunit I